MTNYIKYAPEPPMSEADKALMAKITKYSFIAGLILGAVLIGLMVIKLAGVI